jgi:hypothetical protein
MLQHEVPRYFPLQLDSKVRKEVANKAGARADQAGLRGKGTNLGVCRAPLDKAKCLQQPDYSDKRIQQTFREDEHDKLMASNVLQVEVREPRKNVLCHTIA